MNNECYGCKSYQDNINSPCFLLIKDKEHCPCRNCIVKAICLNLCDSLKSCIDVKYMALVDVIYKDGVVVFKEGV